MVQNINLLKLFLLILYENKYYMQVYLETCADEFVSTQMIDYLDENLFEWGKN